MYFSKQKDFSLHRLLKMLFRLNFLVFCVIVTNNLPYARYYVCAMHTYWFLSIWAVMATYSKYNEVWVLDHPFVTLSTPSSNPIIQRFISSNCAFSRYGFTSILLNF